MARLWIWTLAVGAVLTAGYFVVRHLTDSGVATDVYYAGSSLWAMIIIVVGIALQRPARPAPWILLAAGQLAYTAGDTTYLVTSAVGRYEFPNLADVFYLIQFPLVISALAVIIRRRTPGWHSPSVIDAAVLGAAATLVWWVYVISPLTTGVGLSGAALFITVAYPVLDLLMLFAGLRLMLGGGGHPLSFRLLVGGLAAMLVGDAAYSIATATGSGTGAWIDGVWLSSYFLGAAAAMHPSMRTLDMRAQVQAPGANSARLATLVAASLLAPVVLLVENARGSTGHDSAIAVSCIISFLLVLARMVGLVKIQRLTATTDGLTGLRSRGHFNEVLPVACERARRIHTPVGMVIVDADFFKLINDTHGHPAGDEVLVEIGRRLRAVVRPTDVVARYGGEEFAVLVPDAGADEVRALGERVRTAIGGAPITVNGDVALTVTVSVGVASAEGRAAEPESLVRAADQALYSAKRGGRDQVRWTDPRRTRATVLSTTAF